MTAHRSAKVIGLEMPRGPTQIPDYIAPENASVFDSPMHRAMRYLAQALGADDPTSQVFGLVNPLGMAAEKPAERAAKGAIERLIRAYKGAYPYNESGELIQQFKSQGVKAPGMFENYVGKKGGFAGFFSDSPAVASRFAGPGSAVYPVDIEPFTKPLVIDAKGSHSAALQFADMAKKPHEKAALMELWDTLRGKNAGGYDGVIIQNTADEGTVYVPLDPNRVYSAFERRK